MLAHRLVSHTGVECCRYAGRVKGSQPVQVLLHYVDGRQPLHEAKNSFGDTKLVIRLQHVLLRAGCFCPRVDVHVPKVLRWIVALQVWLDAPSRRGGGVQCLNGRCVVSHVLVCDIPFRDCLPHSMNS